MDPNERLTGIAQMAPASMGGLPMQDPNAPPMQDPSAGMGVMGAPPPPEMMPPEMMASEPQEMQEGESTMLAEAVMERTDGDIEAAIVILNEATDKLMASADQSNQDPMMANMGGPMYMNMGGSVDYKMGGGPLYREDGGGMSDTDVLKQMIMNDVQKLNKGGSPLKAIPEDNAGLRKLPDAVRNKMGFMNRGGVVNPELQRIERDEFNRGMDALRNRFS